MRAAASEGTGAREGLPPRAIGLWGGLSANVLNMIGIGPFVTIPLALSALAGPGVLLGWIAGALLCLCDGLVWAELGSTIPESGGPYHYLREAYGREGAGRLFGFLYLWQTLLTAPLSIASAAVGFAQYAGFLMPSLGDAGRVVMAAGLCLFNTAVLYRRIGHIQKLSMLVSAVVVAACAWIVVTGIAHFDMAVARRFLDARPDAGQGFWLGLGAVALIAVYDYGGYNNVCMLGGEVRKPRRTIPRAVLLSIPLVALLYLGLNVSILGVLPWEPAAGSKAVVADFMQAIHGRSGGMLAVALILLASWGSALVVLLGYSRVPFAAARDGQFFRVFGSLHPRGGFPTVSLVFVGITSALACFLSLERLIATLMVVQILFQYIAQCFAVVALRRRRTAPEAFRMPLYPLPIVVSVVGWLYLVATAGWPSFVVALLAVVVGTLIFLVQSRRTRTWPFQST
ncbi:amino acid permease [Luteibacter sp. 3190]|uniref:APC family permease n=1 Tax=Luteibacter sp. 3190 TaxID=2817736 RepID=UPI0028590A4C|nr:amino acid permease [Luteibacter sp. 3190]MDR6935594.1 amino acid transporter [Luteibacter sp. 3190]